MTFTTFIDQYTQHDYSFRTAQSFPAVVSNGFHIIEHVDLKKCALNKSYGVWFMLPLAGLLPFWFSNFLTRRERVKKLENTELFRLIELVLWGTDLTKMMRDQENDL